MPFDSINLAGDGYTAQQIQAQVRKALAYRPAAIVVMAGVNDVINDGYNQEDVVADLEVIARLIADSSSQCLITLPIMVRDTPKSQRIAGLNKRLRLELSAVGCEILDLNAALAPNGVLLDPYTTDGVHLTREGYQRWAGELSRRLD